MAKSSDAQEFGLPLDLEPMEAKSAQELPNEEGWQYEPKWDGFRCLAFKEGDVVDIRAKSGKPLGRYFPEILSLLGGLPLERFVVDGELVIELEGRLSFEALQMRLHPAESRIRKLSASTPAKLVLFDFLLSPDGTSYVDEPLVDRRTALETVMNPHLKPAELVLSPFTTDIEQARGWLSEAGNGGTDGVVCKRLGGRYEVGTRAMVKVKRLRTADCVVGGFRYETKIQGGRFPSAGALQRRRASWTTWASPRLFRTPNAKNSRGSLKRCGTLQGLQARRRAVLADGVPNGPVSGSH